MVLLDQSQIKTKLFMGNMYMKANGNWELSSIAMTPNGWYMKVPSVW